MAGKSVLAVGAHPDDIELGCGASLLAHAAAGDVVTMLVMTGGESGPGAALKAAALSSATSITTHVDLVMAESLTTSEQPCRSPKLYAVWQN